MWKKFDILNIVDIIIKFYIAPGHNKKNTFWLIAVVVWFLIVKAIMNISSANYFLIGTNKNTIRFAFCTFLVLFHITYAYNIV